MNAKPAHGLCETCHSVLSPSHVEDGTYAPYEYGGPIASVVAAAKFHRRESSAVSLGRLLAEDPRARQLARGAEAVVAIPLSPLRHFDRGFNPSRVIARECGRAWNIPLRPLLKRIRETRPQSELALAERAVNVLDAFTVVAQVPPSIALIDDVVTSGATLNAAAEALRRAGAERVVQLAVCRSE